MAKKISDKNRYSIITDNLEECIECFRPATDLHEIYYGRNRQCSKQYGAVIPLCNSCHSNLHLRHENDLKWKYEVQNILMKHYNWDTDKFIEIFGKNYIG